MSRLAKLTKDYEQSKNDLEEAKVKLEKSSNKDNAHKKLELQQQKKVKDIEKKLENLKPVSNRVTSLSENHERKVSCSLRISGINKDSQKSRIILPYYR